jgi:hypothetical protein
VNCRRDRLPALARAGDRGARRRPGGEHRPEDAQAVLDEDASDPNGLDDVDGKAREESLRARSPARPRAESRRAAGGHAAAPLTGSAGDSTGAAAVAKAAGLPLALVLLASGLLGLRRSPLS